MKFDKLSLIGLGLTAAGGILSFVKGNIESRQADARMKEEISKKLAEYMSQMNEESTTEEEETEEEP